MTVESKERVNYEVPLEPVRAEFFLALTREHAVEVSEKLSWRDKFHNSLLGQRNVRVNYSRCSEIVKHYLDKQKVQIQESSIDLEQLRDSKTCVLETLTEYKLVPPEVTQYVASKVNVRSAQPGEHFSTAMPPEYLGASWQSKETISEATIIIQPRDVAEHSERLGQFIFPELEKDERVAHIDVSQEELVALAVDSIVGHELGHTLDQLLSVLHWKKSLRIFRDSVYHARTRIHQKLFKATLQRKLYADINQVPSMYIYGLQFGNETSVERIPRFRSGDAAIFVAKTACYEVG